MNNRIETELSKYDVKSDSLFFVKDSFIHRNITDMDILVSVGENIVNFNGYIELNKSAAFLWDCMKNGSTVKNMAISLKKKFGVDEKTALNDTLDFLKELLEHDMVVVK